MDDSIEFLLPVDVPPLPRACVNVCALGLYIDVARDRCSITLLVCVCVCVDGVAISEGACMCRALKAGRTSFQLVFVCGACVLLV